MQHISWLVMTLCLYKYLFPETPVHASVEVSRLPFEYGLAAFRGPVRGWKSEDGALWDGQTQTTRGKSCGATDLAKFFSSGLMAKEQEPAGRGLKSDGFWLKEPTLWFFEEKLQRVLFVRPDKSWLIVQDLGIEFPVRTGKKSLYGRNCLKMEFLGQRIVDLFFSDGKLIVQTVGLGDTREKHWMHVLQIQKCDPTSMEGGYSDLISFDTTYSHSLSAKRSKSGKSNHPCLQTHFVIDLNRVHSHKGQPHFNRVALSGEQIYLESYETPSEISIYSCDYTKPKAKMTKVDPLRFGCRDLLRVQPMNGRIVALCFQEGKLAVQVKLVVMKEVPTNGRDPTEHSTWAKHDPLNHRQRVVSEVYFTEDLGFSRIKRNMKELVSSWDSFQLSLSPNKQSIFGVIPGTIFWLVQEENNKLFEPRMKLIRTPIDLDNQPQEIKFLSNNEAYILFKDFSTSTMNPVSSKHRESLIIGVHRDRAKDWASSGFVQTRFRMKGSEFRHFEAVTIDQEVFTLTVDPNNGVVLSHLITMSAYHANKYTVFYLGLLVCLFVAKVGLMMNAINAICLGLKSLKTAILNKSPKQNYPAIQLSQLIESVKYFDPTKKFPCLDISNTLNAAQQHSAQPQPDLPETREPEAQGIVQESIDHRSVELFDTPTLGGSLAHLVKAGELDEAHLNEEPRSEMTPNITEIHTEIPEQAQPISPFTPESLPNPGE